MKRILSILLSLAMAFAATGSFGQAEMLKQKEPVLAAVSEASWNHGYDTLAEMTEGSDLILRGTVLSSQTELRHDLVFTRFTVSVDQLFSGGDPGLERVEILQTGGSYEEEYTPAINGAPLLRQGEEYLLYLEYAETEQYGNYYLIAGANQGVAKIAENSSEASPFSMAGEQLSLIPYGTDEVILGERQLHGLEKSTASTCGENCTNFLIWYTTNSNEYVNVKYYIHATPKGTTYDNAIRDGVTSWNGISSHYNYSRVTNVGTANLTAQANSYGFTGWDGYTYIYYLEGTSQILSEGGDPYIYTPIHKAIIALNYSYLIDENVDYWKKVTIHETGHATSLSHHTCLNDTVMWGDTSQYLSYSSPTTRDRNNVVYFYNLGYAYLNS